MDRGVIIIFLFITNSAFDFVNPKSIIHYLLEKEITDAVS